MGVGVTLTRMEEHRGQSPDPVALWDEEVAFWRGFVAAQEQRGDDALAAQGQEALRQALRRRACRLGIPVRRVKCGEP